MYYRQASMDDLHDIVVLVEDAKTLMEKQGIHQWNKYYPHKKDFIEDINNKHLYVVKDNNELLSIYTLNEDVDEAYNKCKWSSDNYCVIHRLCVSPSKQGKGIGRQVLSHIEKQAREMGYETIRLDVFSLNDHAKNLYKKQGYTKHGVAEWFMGKFYLMEKVIK